jgi:hypothetical protein
VAVCLAAYLAAQVVVVPAVLIWLYRGNRMIYVRLRDTVLATWMLAVPIFWLFPVAPPRLSGIGIVDTISAGIPDRARSRRDRQPLPARRRDRARHDDRRLRRRDDG